MNNQDQPSDQQLQDGIIYAKKKALLKQLKNIEADLPKVNLVLPWYRQWKWWLLGVIVLTLGLTAFFMFKNKAIQATPSSVNPVIAAYFKHNPSYTLDRSKEEPATLEEKAFAAYNQKNYANATPLLEDLFLVQQDTLALFWLGIAQLGNGDALNAIESLSKFQDLQPEVLTEKTAYYLMLAHLQLKNFEAVKDYASQLDSPELKLIAEEVLETIDFSH